MNTNKAGMPPEYEYLNAPLNRAQEHVFLINAEIEKVQDNPLNEAKVVNLQDEKQAVIGGIKQDFEMQTWEEGPAKFEEIEKVIDQKFSDEAYNKTKPGLLESGKQYHNSNYWGDKLERNLEHYKRVEKEAKHFDRRDWAYPIFENKYMPGFDDRDFDLDKD